MLGYTVNWKRRMDAQLLQWRETWAVPRGQIRLWLVGCVAGWAFLCCCHNGIITPWDKSLAAEKRAVESLKLDASVWIMLLKLQSLHSSSVALLPLICSFNIFYTSVYIMDCVSPETIGVKLELQCECSAWCLVVAEDPLQSSLFFVCKQDRAQWLQHR